MLVMRRRNISVALPFASSANGRFSHEILALLVQGRLKIMSTVFSLAEHSILLTVVFWNLVLASRGIQ